MGISPKDALSLNEAHMKHTRESAGADQPDTDGERRVKRKLPIWKKLLLGLVVTCLFFGALELVLALCGVRPILYSEDPFVGFASNIPLFVEEARSNGEVVLRTALNKRPYFNLQEFPKKKPWGAFRIFCVGGSTTFGSPYDDRTSFCGWLRALLPVADPSRKWEVINAGGLSYASYRLCVVMEELCQYEPDLFIIYCGHNEFLERRTYRKILKTPSAVVRAATALSRTRTARAIRWGLKALGVVPQRPRRPDPDRNILPGEVQAILDNTVGPSTYTRDEEWAEQVVAHYRLNLGRMIDIARQAGAEVMLVTPASNLRDCSPFKSEHRAGLSPAEKERWEALFGQALRAPEARKASEALTALDAAAAIDDRYAELHYRRGKVLYALRRYAEAKKAFRRAIDEDICPLRALTRMVDIAVEVAAERRVPLVDFARLVADRSERGIPGSQHFLDHIHPRIAAHRMLALAIIERLGEQGTVELAPSWDERAIDAVARKVEGHINNRARGRALRSLSKVLGWAGRFEESRRLALQALELLADDVESLFQVGACSQVLGDAQQAVTYLRKALELDPTYGRAHLWLGNALIDQGQTEAAIRHYRDAVRLLPDHAEARRRLTKALQGQEQTLGPPPLGEGQGEGP